MSATSLKALLAAHTLRISFSTHATAGFEQSVNGWAFNSSWIDDLAYSSENPRPIINVVIGALRESGFQISRKKLEIAGPGKRKILNGVLIARPRLSVPPDRLARIRSGIHKLEQSQIPTDEVDRYVRALRGSIAHVSMINPFKASRLRADLEAAIQSWKPR